MATITVGVLALQGAFVEHVDLLRRAGAQINDGGKGSDGAAKARNFEFIEVRTPEQLSRCKALIIPGGESTTLAFVAAQTKLLEPLRQFVKIDRNPTWGTCAGLIFLADEATGSKKGGQELVGGLHIRAHRNHFGRQVHSFQSDLDLPFLSEVESLPDAGRPYPGVFIRAPVVEKILPGEESGGNKDSADVEVLGVVHRGSSGGEQVEDIIAVRQGNIFATSFHPELTADVRIHQWWLHQVLKVVDGSDR